MSGTGRSGLGYRCRRCAPRSRPESALTHTVTHTGKCADGNNGTNRLRPLPFWTKKRRKALYSKGWKALQWLVRMRSAVRICPAAPKKHRKLRFSMLFVAKMLKNVWVKMWVNCLTHTVTHTRNKLYPRKWTRDFDPWPRSADTHLTHRGRSAAPVL